MTFILLDVVYIFCVVSRIVKTGVEMLNKQKFYESFSKFLNIFKGYLLISIFAILMVSIQCKSEPPSSSAIPSLPPSPSPSPPLPIFDPICTDGAPSTEKFFEANTQKCLSCNNGFKIEGDICIIVPVSTLAGGGSATTGTACSGTLTASTCRNGTGIDAQFNGPSGIAVDSDGVLYVADTFNHRIRKITFNETGEGEVSTLAGGDKGINTNAITECGTTTLISHAAGNSTNHCKDGTGTDAHFHSPRGIAVGSDGVLYVADTGNDRIRKINISTKKVTTLAGGNTGTSTNPTITECGTQIPADPLDTTIICKDGTGTDAQFNSPRGIAVDGSGFVYVADTNNHRIRKINISTKEVTTLAGGGSSATTGTVCSGISTGCRNGTGTDAQFNQPRGVAVDNNGIVYVADTANRRIRKITISTKKVTTFVGDGNIEKFYRPNGIVTNDLGNIYVADTRNNRIRKITISTKKVTTFAGGSIAGNGNTRMNNGWIDASVEDARFHFPRGIAVDSNGIVYVADTFNNSIRRIRIETE